MVAVAGDYEPPLQPLGIRIQEFPCPVCNATNKYYGQDVNIRAHVVDRVECPLCGKPLRLASGFPDDDADVACTSCEWEGHLSIVNGRNRAEDRE